MAIARSLRSTGITPLHHYYGAAYQPYKVFQRSDLQRAGCRNSKEIIYHRRDGHEIAGRIVRQFVVDQWIDRDYTSKREHQCVIVARCKETHDGRDAVAALAILHDHGLAPALGKALREQTRLCPSRCRAGAVGLHERSAAARSG